MTLQGLPCTTDIISLRVNSPGMIMNLLPQWSLTIMKVVSPVGRVPGTGRFAQVLTWGRLGLKRGGTAWYQIYGKVEGTYISEAYSYDGTSAAEIISQLVQTEGGRCFTQANGSLVYNYRWNLYNQPVVATYGDNNTTELPFEQSTEFSVDNQFIYNLINATQNRGPDQAMFYQASNIPSSKRLFYAFRVAISGLCDDSV